MVKRRPRPNRVAGSYRRAIQEEVTEALVKALSLPRGATTQQITEGYLASLQRNGSPRIDGVYSLPRDPNNLYPFGPGEAPYPAPIAPVLPSTGRQPPQLRDFATAWNTQIGTSREIPFTILRDASHQVSIVRACIDVCISSITGLDWSFGIDSSKARALAKKSNTSSHEVISDLQDKFADDIERLHSWWQKPDRINNLTFVQWLTMLMEDEIVLDAVSLYPHFALGGDLHSMEIVDSATIKPLLDDRGATPQPPYPAYQQIRYGFPRGEYTQSQDPDQEFTSVIYGKPASSADTDQLMYKVRNCRSSSPYGFSNVERALIDIDLWLKRYDWLRSEYSAGVTPEMVVKVDMAMTPEQLRQYESIFNDDLSGRTAERHRARFLPSGFDPSYPGNLDAKFASDLDLHIVRLICASFDVLPTSLGFTPNHNPGMAGNSNQKGEQDSQLARGTKPRVKFLVGLINEISHNYLGMPNEVTFAFHGIDDEDEQKEAALLEGYIASGLMVINEGRDRLNLPRFGIDQANEPFISTPTGPSFLNPKVQPSGMPGNLPSAGQNAPGGRPTDPNPGGKENGYQPSVEVRAANEPRDESVQGKKAEQKAFMSCVQASLKQGKQWRDFTFKVYDPITGEAANRLAAAGDVDACKALFMLRDEP